MLRKLVCREGEPGDEANNLPALLQEVWLYYDGVRDEGVVEL